MDEQQQREVARGLRQGDPGAWQALYDAYCRRVWCSVARRMGPESADVADVVQETFLAAARSARQYDPARGSLWMWLGGIARRHVALHYRKQKRRDRLRDADDRLALGRREVMRWLDDGRDVAADALGVVEVSSLVRAALTELPVDYEILLTAKYFDGATVEEIAGQQQCSSTAVRSKLARARRAFRAAFSRTSSCASDGRGRETT